jgi:hypothetical protein
MLTFMIYLNGGFTGGATHFLGGNETTEFGNSVINGQAITAKIVPEPGMVTQIMYSRQILTHFKALVFQHHMYHGE